MNLPPVCRRIEWAVPTCLSVMLTAVQAQAIAPSAPPDPVGHHEAQDEPPAPMKDRAVDSAPRVIVTWGPYQSVQVNVNAAGDDIIGDAANEPSIAVDPENADRIAIGWRQFDSITSSFRQAGRGYSTDGGHTWEFLGPHQPGIFRSDPVLDYDADGVFYYNSLRNDFTCQYFMSSDGGQSWSGPIDAYGGDKQWSAIDRTNGIGRGNIYVAWSPAAGCCGTRLFTRSTDGGFTFMNPITLPGSPMWGTLAVGSTGDLYICSQATSGFVTVQRSTNAKDAGVAPTFPLVRSVYLGGNTRSGVNPNPGGLLGQMWIACSPPGGPWPTHVYLLGSVDPPGADPLDIMFTRSTDGGLTWEAPRRVNDDPAGPGAHQWFGSMSVAPHGRIDAVWNDTRGNPGSVVSQLYYASSRDGGASWSANVAVSPPFDPSLGYPNQNKLGDYYHSISHNGRVHVAYAATFSGGEDVYYLRIPIDCNENGADDGADITGGTSFDCNSNGTPDECDRDCDHSGRVDECELAAGSVADCDANQVPDVCDLAGGRLFDCDDSGVPDVCEVAAGSVPDCNANGVPDGCDIASGEDDDCDGNGVPDVCDSAASSQAIVSPVTVQACVDGQAHFSVSATGATGYQWRKDGQDLAQATGSELLVDPVGLNDEGEYSCRVSFGCIVAESAAAALRVVPLQVSVTSLSAPPAEVCSQSGTIDAMFSVGVDDLDGVLYQWSHAGNDLVNGGRISGAQAASLFIRDLQLGDAGAYTCRVWNICIAPFEAVTTNAVITVIDPVFTLPPMHACAELGGTATFHADVETSAANPLVYRWYEGATLLSNGGRFMGATTNTLHVSAVTLADAGRRFRLRAVVPAPLCSLYSSEALILIQSPGGCAACPTPGDLDADGDYDLLDVQGFALCFEADVGDRPECRCANVRGEDEVVDTSDWGLLSQILDGPQGP